MRIDVRVRINQGQLLEFIKQPLVQLFAHDSVLRQHLDVTADRVMPGLPVAETDTKKRRPPFGPWRPSRNNQSPLVGRSFRKTIYGLKALTSFPFFPFQSRTTPSSPPATTIDSSRLDAAAYMKSVPPLKLR